MKRYLQHYLNAMHLYCFMVRLGCNRKRALALARWWEKAVHLIIY